MLKLGFPCGSDNSKADRILQILTGNGIPSKIEYGKHGITVTYSGNSQTAMQVNRLVNSVAK